MFNPTIIFELQNKWRRFTENHPKFPKFMQAVVGTKLSEGTIIDIKFTTADGQEICSNVKLNAEDIEMLEEIGELVRGMH